MSELTNRINKFIQKQLGPIEYPEEVKEDLPGLPKIKKPRTTGSGFGPMGSPKIGSKPTIKSINKAGDLRQAKQLDDLRAMRDASRIKPPGAPLPPSKK